MLRFRVQESLMLRFRFSTPSSNHCPSLMQTISDLRRVACGSSVARDPADVLLLWTLGQPWRSLWFVTLLLAGVLVLHECDC